MEQDQKFQIYLEKALAGDQTAFKYILNLYWSGVYNFIFLKLNNEIISEDITVITFSKAFEKLSQYNPDYSFKTWIYTIAKNVLIDEYRKSNNNIISVDVDLNDNYQLYDDTPSAEDAIIIQQNLAGLKINIQKLKPKYQEVIQLRYFQDMSYQEISTQLNEPINNIKIKLLRAKKQLADIITNPNKT